MVPSAYAQPMFDRPSDGNAGIVAAVPAHRLDEFPVGYSSASCTPALLASASPTGPDYALKSYCWATTFQRPGEQCLNWLSHARGQAQIGTNALTCSASRVPFVAAFPSYLFLESLSKSGLDPVMVMAWVSWAS